ncbi:hypothetical protein [Kordiimonas aquimaris]|uniref:hypothetical protein n=1 Tax=Kordiimonas aquimaris TaxID=707591 RepID=UPI0021D1EFC9|nr:hypothetical protein [Kordiimonas aquimaris]
MSFVAPGLAAYNEQQQSAAQPSGGGFFGRLLDGAGQIGLAALGFEAQKSILRDQLKITNLEAQIATAEQRAGSATATGAVPAQTDTFAKYKPWLIGGGVVVVLAVAAKWAFK